MTQSARVLIAGESWIMHTIHQKGVDAFTTTAYGEGVGWLRAALEDGGIGVDHLPNHLAPSHFPSTLEHLRQYAAIVLSDIGSNSLLLSPDTFERSVPMPNRLALLRDYVAAGGGLIMVGGYLTFQGIEGKARYARTPVEEALPVTMLTADDRVEVPEGCSPEVVKRDHPIVDQLPDVWPRLLGYNRVRVKPGGTVIASVGDDPLLVVWQYERGRAVAFTSDCSPHWCSLEFLEWAGYGSLWRQIIRWVTKG